MSPKSRRRGSRSSNLQRWLGLSLGNSSTVRAVSIVDHARYRPRLEMARMRWRWGLKLMVEEQRLKTPVQWSDDR